MPNTLAHFGIQTVLSKAAFRRTDSKWIGLGCLLPDLPWISQRLIYGLHIVNPVDLRLYVIIQSSLFMTLILAAAISLQVRYSRRIFLVLAGNCLLHLLLDATQIKWANGIHLLAPFSWKLINYGSYWPEQLPALMLTLAGLLLFPFFVWKDRNKTVTVLCRAKRQTAGCVLLAIYLILPCFLLSGPRKANNHFTATLISGQRTGQYIEIDRKPYRAEQHTIESLSGERLHLRGKNLPRKDTTLSLQGTFLSQNTILISKYHVHTPLRDTASIVGISMLLASWLVALLGKRITVCSDQ